MKKYLAIGHFKGSENMVSVALECRTMESFRQNLIGNEFVAWAIITEERFRKMAQMDDFDLFEEVKKIVGISNYRRWLDVTEYIEQCSDIMEERFANA